MVQRKDGNHHNLAAENLFVVSRSNLPAVINYMSEKFTLICPVCQQHFEEKTAWLRRA